MSVFVLEFKFREWDENEEKWTIKSPDEYQFYADAETALKTASEVANIEYKYRQRGCPSSISLYSFQDYDVVTANDIRLPVTQWTDLKLPRRYWENEIGRKSGENNQCQEF